jgi:hypothetical protein
MQLNVLIWFRSILVLFYCGLNVPSSSYEMMTATAEWWIAIIGFKQEGGCATGCCAERHSYYVVVMLPQLASQITAGVQSLCVIAVSSWYLRPGTARELRRRAPSVVESRYQATTVQTWLWALAYVCNSDPYCESKSSINPVINPNLGYSHTKSRDSIYNRQQEVYSSSIRSCAQDRTLIP